MAEPRVQCPTCKGSGRRPISDGRVNVESEACFRCNGTGQVEPAPTDITLTLSREEALALFSCAHGEGVPTAAVSARAKLRSALEGRDG